MFRVEFELSDGKGSIVNCREDFANMDGAEEFSTYLRKNGARMGLCCQYPIMATGHSESESRVELTGLALVGA